MTKSRQLMDRVEGIVKLVVEATAPGTEMVFQDEQSHGEFDFDLHYPNGTVAAVEVTRSVDKLQIQTSAAIHSNKKQPVMNAVKCKSTWYIIPMQNANINTIREKADAYLAVLEDAGISEFSVFEANESKQIKEAGLEEIFAEKVVPQCVESICDHLMLQGGRVISSEGPPKIILGYPIYGGAVVADCAINAGKAEAWKEDNRKKLGAAATDERHLAVFIDVTNGLAWSALSHCEPPLALPELPTEINHLWLLGKLGGTRRISSSFGAPA